MERAQLDTVPVTACARSSREVGQEDQEFKAIQGHLVL